MKTIFLVILHSKRFGCASFPFVERCRTKTRNINKKKKINMEKVIIESYEDFLPFVGKEIGVSDYLVVDQERINLFADATLDHQWIHVDTEKAKVESPFGQTIAHGYLTMSLLPYFWNQIVDVRNLERQMNYGMDKMKFAQPVLSGQSVRMTTKLEEIQNLRGAIKTTIKFTIEVKETGKKTLEGLATFIYYFKK